MLFVSYYACEVIWLHSFLGFFTNLIKLGFLHVYFYYGTFFEILDMYDHNAYLLQEAVQLLKDGIDLITDADKALINLLSYPIYATLTR